MNLSKLFFSLSVKLCASLIILLTFLSTNHLYVHEQQLVPVMSAPSVPHSPTIILVSSRQADDQVTGKKGIDIFFRICLTLISMGIFPFGFVGVVALMNVLANPVFWLFVLLNLVWILGFGLSYVKIWNIRSKRKRRRGILFASIGITLLTGIVLQLFELVLFVPYVALLGQVLLTLLGLGIIFGLMWLGIRWRNGRRTRP